MNLRLYLIITQLFQVFKNKICLKNNFFPTYIPLFLWSVERKQEYLFLGPDMNGLFIFVSYM